ncbi:alcohol dehydrogenase catalytic domain-containing protein [Rhodococcus sp. CX]|uniref:zinc-dependent alcohol dehydrogenase n=1 Tax=Rhodococcus sp. CX TaxID=2789880 RepID=UPI0018CF8742|nr:alcohol dehydrogenase catalytic domain-containing protein [Rhodococcus sp. CX]MBH0122673.1 alcohol dehydrogenase catalytic domain-containing protein [Rhodococcus sp. CX]
MRRAVISEPGVVEVIDSPLPSFTEDQVLVRVLRFSPYGTDIEIAAAREPRYVRDSYPIGFGVDFAGVIDQVGAAVEGWDVGDRVTATGLPTCGACRMCEAGRTNLCHSFIAGEVPRQEVAQEYVAVDAAQLTRIPPEVGLDDAAMLSGVMTAVNGFDLVNAGEGDDCVVMGLGAMGLAGVAVAVARGCRVVGVGVGADNQRMARELGCHEVIDVPEHDFPVRDLVRRVLPDGPSVVYESTCRDWGIAQAFEVCGYGGRVVLLGGGSLPADGWALIERELTVVGVRAAPNKEKSLRLLSQGSVDLKSTIAQRITLEEVPAVFADWINRSPNRVRGRVMVDVSNS